MILALFFPMSRKMLHFRCVFSSNSVYRGGGSNTNYAHRYRQTAMTAMQAVMAVYKILECSA